MGIKQLFLRKSKGYLLNMQAVIFTLFPFVYNYVHSLFPYNLCFRPYIIKFDTLDSLQ